MTNPFHPRLDLLPSPQRRLWDELGAMPADFTLYGGTAIALHLGHRHSVDFDFFGNRAFGTSDRLLDLPFMKGAEIIQRDASTLTCMVDRGGEVKLSFFGVPRLRRLAPPCVAHGNGLRVAALADLAGTKISVLQLRAEAKDYLDIDALLEKGGLALPGIIALGHAIYGTRFNPSNALKALCYFADGSVAAIPDAMKRRLCEAARRVDLDRLPAIADILARHDRPHPP